MERAKTLAARIGIPGALVLGAVVLSSAEGLRRETAPPEPPPTEEVQAGLVKEERPHPPVPSRTLPGPDPSPASSPALPSPPTLSKVPPGELPVEDGPPPMGEPLDREPISY
jgi:hypothetical protein